MTGPLVSGAGTRGPATHGAGTHGAGTGPWEPLAGPVHLPVRVGPPNNLSDGHLTGLTSVFRHVMWRDAAGFRLAFANWHNDGGREADPPNPITVSAAVRSERGTEVSVRFAGATRIRIAPGGSVVSDAVPLALPRGALLVSRVSVTVGPGEVIPLGPQTDGAGGMEGVTFRAGVPLDRVPANTAYGYAPWAVLGETGVGDGAGGPAARAVGLIVGDSNGAGYGDVRGAACHRGWVSRAFDGRIGYLNISLSGATVQGTLSPEGMRRRLALAAYVRPSFVIAALGTNDLQGGGVSGAAMADRLVAHWRRLAARGQIVHACTIPPVTSSDDGWTSEEGQLPDAGWRERAEVNAWIRTVPEPLTGVIDVAAAVESGRRPAVWKRGYTADGVHMNATGHAAVAAVVAGWLPTAAGERP
ncbi:SGNH/GDSL hydrolase family protein [Phytoactinopolyspora halotolerans]|uniref:SGNH/GDSL hydrolase family protein n=1 Tax=Phytoactinopolyspora halotolerans TaxID=1981512 RepID=A0A6L9SJ42_9ACTN|nr:SGNH/GDSL hydrolase family protein [Phytoactinopolyspora halotolerans]NEE04708.1 SGNH/GDSL hydrolase family protein [Phytoactinopolyspora halotolerans]